MQQYSDEWRKESVAALHEAASKRGDSRKKSKSRPASASARRKTPRPQSARPVLGRDRPQSARPRAEPRARPGSARPRSARHRGPGPATISQVSQALARNVYQSSPSPDGKRRPQSAQPRSRGSDDGGWGISHARVMSKEQLFHRQISRVRLLWEELRLPERDRDVFSHRYFGRRTPASESALAAHLSALVAHRASTIKVLHLIRMREDRLAAVRNAFRSALAREEDDGDELPVFCSSLLELRKASVVLFEAIAEWRRQLSRPKPFLWRSVNYVQKMASDAQFLVSDSALRLLNDLSLPAPALPVLLPTLPKALAKQESFYRVNGECPSAFSLVPQLELESLPAAERRRVLGVARALVDEPQVQQALDQEMRELAAQNLVVPTLSGGPEDDDDDDDDDEFREAVREVPRKSRDNAPPPSSDKQTRLRLRRELENARRFGAENVVPESASDLPRPGAPTPALQQQQQQQQHTTPVAAEPRAEKPSALARAVRRTETLAMSRGTSSKRNLLKSAAVLSSVPTPSAPNNRALNRHASLRPAQEDSDLDPNATYETPLPTIKCHLQLPVDDHTVEVGSDVLLTGRPPLPSGVNPVARPKAHQWFKDGVLLPGATNSSMLLGSTAVEDSGLYMCQVTYHTGDLATSEYMLRVVDSGAVALSCVVSVAVKDAASNDALSSAVVNVVDGNELTEAGAPRGRLLAKIAVGNDGLAVVKPVASWVGRRLRLYASQSGFAGASVPLHLRSQQEPDKKEVLSLSSFTSSGKVRLVLTWGAEPSALDMRVLCPSGAVVRYSSQAAREDRVYLERDISNGFGPQTVIMEAPGAVDGWYRVVVCPAPRQGSLRRSEARLAVVDSRGLLRVFELPTFPEEDEEEDQVADRDRMLWDVCAIHGRTGEVLGCSRLAADVPSRELAIPALLDAAAWAASARPAASPSAPRTLAELVRLVVASSSSSSASAPAADALESSYEDDFDSDSGSDGGGDELVSFDQFWRTVKGNNVPLSEDAVVALLDVLEPADFAAIGPELGTVARLRASAEATALDGMESD